ncbi:SRPBCC domain-containing protein [Aquiflexum sp.]|uniref:SRPBCC domain-containing protein n=1 Tax=Aquiflexum sp. TaxID=1872584 RepID=UPI003593B3EF
MEQKQYKIEIKASIEKVFDYMLGLSSKKTYEQWTSVFNPASTFEGSWEKGSGILFIGTNENGNREGMISRIIKNIPNQLVSVQHYGILEGEKEILEGTQVDQWAGGMENYSFEKNGNKTIVTVEVDVTGEFSEHFDSTYPKALQKLKEIVEAE